MRKSIPALTLCLILCIILVLIPSVSCTGVNTMNPERLKIDKAYEFTAAIQYGEFTATGEFSRRNADSWKITMLEPFAFEGVILTYSAGSMTAQFENLNTTLPESAAVFTMMIASFENAVNGEGREVVSAKEQITVTSRAEGKSYTLVLDKRTLEPISLKMPEVSLSAEFSQVQVSQVVPVIQR
jgi:hypothetical protein